ncbi:serine/arginine repetitive matrix protein 2 [Streptomyces sp. YPW6]|uniref:serine/arginine repetitive matrix protein 2 n=1 Tax=Streptomyces sp. YPW6 TaxID=2840373 RepID=UPI003D72FF14
MAGGGVRWNDESQSWETDEPRADGPPPPVAAPVVPPVPPVPPTAPVPPGAHPNAQNTAPGPYAQTTAPGPSARSGADAPEPYDSPTGVHGPPPAARTSRQRLVPVAAGLAVAVLAAGAAALWSTLADGDDGGRDGARGQSASAPADGAADPAAPEPGAEGTDPTGGSPSDAAATPDGSPPPGYVALDDAEGFRIAVPEKWEERSAETGGVFYRTTGGAELIQVFRVAEPGATALGSVRRASDERSGAPGFEEVGIGPVDNPEGGEAAELVYAYDHEESGGRRRVVERVFTASDDRLYAVLVAAPESDWPRHEEILDVAVSHFDPYGRPF